MNKSVVTKEKTELKDQLREQISLSWLASGRTKEHWRPWVLWAFGGKNQIVTAIAEKSN